MKYLCLVYLDESRLAELPDEECVAYDEAIRESRHCLASEALESVRTVSTVRVRSGKITVTDGPFAETKEQLAGFYFERGDPACLEDPAGARGLRRGAPGAADTRNGGEGGIASTNPVTARAIERR